MRGLKKEGKLENPLKHPSAQVKNLQQIEVNYVLQGHTTTMRSSNEDQTRRNVVYSGASQPSTQINLTTDLC